MNPKISIIMGSTSDLPVMKEAAKVLDELEIPFEINVFRILRSLPARRTFACFRRTTLGRSGRHGGTGLQGDFPSGGGC